MTDTEAAQLCALITSALTPAEEASAPGDVVHRAKRSRATSCAPMPMVERATCAPRLAIIVPFRDQPEQRRNAHLKAFMSMMPRWLGLSPGEARVIVAVQPHDGKKFNRGLLLNAGARVAMREGFNTLILHDVDLLPSDDLRFWYTREEPPQTALHIGARWDRYSYPGYLGGVVKIGVSEFVAANGFPNSFWGWGGEDDAFAARLKIAGIEVAKPTVGSLRDLECGAAASERASTRIGDGGRAAWRNMTRREDLARDRTGWRVDGLSTLPAGDPKVLQDTPECLRVEVQTS